MSKNIVICCDGTGNEYGNRNSNVVKLYRTLPWDPQQVAFYDPGVGTLPAPGALSWLVKKWTLLIGLAFGYGISTNIADAYKYLMDLYEPGDKIFLFGFSRGAYTVRALAGLIDMCGLLEKGSDNLIPYALKLFQEKTPDRPELCGGFKTTFCRDCKLNFIGVWDTVSSVGWVYDPVKLPHTANNPALEIIRHAISIDERRCFFRQNVFERSFPEQDIKQVWFAGVHCDVGGGYPESECGLSKIALQWMIREARAAGLLFDEEEVKRVLGDGTPGPGHEAFVKPDYAAKQHESLAGPWWILEFFPIRHMRRLENHWKGIWSIPLGRRRIIPSGVTLHQSVLSRKNDAACRYNPANLPTDFSVEN